MEGLSLDVPAWSRTLWTIPPNSQGYLTLAGAWMASSLPSLPATDPDDPQWAHLGVEVARQAGWDRLTSCTRAPTVARCWPRIDSASRRDAVSSTGVARLGRPEGYADGGTIYLCTADGSGMGVSFIQSNYSGFGSMLVEPSTRIFLQNRGAGSRWSPGTRRSTGPAGDRRTRWRRRW